MCEHKIDNKEIISNFLNTTDYQKMKNHFRTKYPTISEDLDDVFQEVVVKTLRYSDSYEPSRAKSPYSWFYQIAQRTIFDYFKKQKHESEFQDFSKPFEHHHEKRVLHNYIFNNIFDSLSFLTPQSKKVAISKIFLGLDNLEISEVLNIKKSNVATIFSRALDTMGKKFSKKISIDDLAGAHYQLSVDEINSIIFDEEIQKVVLMYESGKSIKAISEDLNLEGSEVRNMLSDGIERIASSQIHRKKDKIDSDILLNKFFTTSICNIVLDVLQNL